MAEVKPNSKGYVTLEHADIEDKVEVLPESLDVWLDNGWKVVETKDEKKTAKAAEAKATTAASSAEKKEN